MNERIIDLTLQGLSDKKIAEITGLPVKKVHEVNGGVRSEMHEQKVKEAERLRREGYSHRQIARALGVSPGTAFYYTTDVKQEKPKQDEDFKREWNAVCRRLNPKAWEGR